MTAIDKQILKRFAQLDHDIPVYKRKVQICSRYLSTLGDDMGAYPKIYVDLPESLSLKALSLRSTLKNLQWKDFKYNYDVEDVAQSLVYILEPYFNDLNERYRVLVRRYQAYNMIPWTIQNMEAVTWNNHGDKIEWSIKDDPTVHFEKSGQAAFWLRRFRNNETQIMDSYYGINLFLPIHLQYMDPDSARAYSGKQIGRSPVSIKTIFLWIFKFYQERIIDSNDINRIKTCGSRSPIIKWAQERFAARMPVRRIDLLYRPEYPEWNCCKFNGFHRQQSRGFFAEVNHVPERYTGYFMMRLTR